jgi:hypothetical protein
MAHPRVARGVRVPRSRIAHHTGVLALLPGDTLESLLIPLAFADGLGGVYTEFLILTFPIYFLINTKRPVFVASLGLAIDVLTAALLWEVDVWPPETFRVLDIPVLVSAAISAIGFVVLVYFLFERHRERTVSAALYALLYGRDSAGVAAESLAEDSAVLPQAGANASAWRLRRLACLMLSRWPYGHAMDSRCVAAPLRKNDMLIVILVRPFSVILARQRENPANWAIAQLRNRKQRTASPPVTTPSSSKRAYTMGHSLREG